ncbi:MAG: hemin-binding protein [Prevotella sp.]|nr:hemin-binding protein [Prevotella sp.]
MKKFFTLIVALFALSTAWADEIDNTFQFTDLEGNPVADGTVITINTINEEGQMIVPLKVKNLSGEKAAVSLFENIDAMPNGTWQTCAFGNCMQLTETGYSPKNIKDADYLEGIQTEWIPEAGKYATWEATLQIHVFNIVTTTRFGVTTETAGEEIIGYGPKVTVRFEYNDPNGQSQTEKLWWGYVNINDDYLSVGTQTAETYYCASCFSKDNPAIAGKNINAVRFRLDTKNVRNVKVWIAEKKPSNLTSDLVRVVSLTSPKEGINEVTFTEPYTVANKNVYVGYTFTISKLQTTADSYPVCCTGSDMANGLLLKTSSTTTSWTDLNGYGFGCLLMDLQIEGEFPYQNAATFASADLGESVAALGGTGRLWLPVTNMGTAPLQNIDFTITTDGVASAEQHIDFKQPINFGVTNTVTVQVDADNEGGQKTKTLNITKVNGVANENDAATATFTMTTLSKLVHRGIAVEEFTGTQCGWCPRGMAGMDKLRQLFGDHFVGTAVHGYANSTSDDAMYLSGWSTKYAKIFSGSAPSCQLNRAYGEIDPYYGTGNSIVDDFENELSIPAVVGIDLKGEWNADSTKVTATATLEALTPGKSYTIEYVLIADSLSGTGKAWNQSNYYASYYSASDLPDDLAMFGAGGQYGQSTIKGWTFNDAVIATCYVSSKNKTTAPGVLTVGEPVTNTYELTMPTNATLKKAINKKNVAVVCLVIGEDKTVANAAKFYMPGYNENGTEGITLVQQDNAVEQRFSLEGHRLQGAKKGLNIIRKADGTTRKVFVR